MFAVVHQPNTSSAVAIEAPMGSIEEITAHMSCGLSGNEAGLLAYWSFETGGLTDDSGNGHDGVAQQVGDAVDFVTPQVSLPGCPP